MALNSTTLATAISTALAASLNATAAETAATAYMDARDAACAAAVPPVPAESADQRAAFIAGFKGIIKAVFDGIVAHAPTGIATAVVDHFKAHAEVAVLPNGSPPFTINDGDGVTNVAGKGTGTIT